MGVLPDWLIQQQIKIEPYAAGQARPGVISYGVTSYGYDVRVGRKFKVFTNVYGAVVDPKNFDSRSFVDVEADYCLIPPNSFALAETVEYLEVPRDILCVCLGKSTYARCFTGDTRVSLAEGPAPTLEEMARRAETGERFWGYSVGPDGRTLVTLLEAPRFIGTENVIEVELDNGQRIRCTPDHGFLMRDGRVVVADQLRPGDSLMPLYRHSWQGREVVYQPHTGRLALTEDLSDDWIGRHAPRFHPPTGRGPVSPRVPREVTLPGLCGWRNHSVVAVRPVPGVHDVYCLSVPEAGNFALEAGVFVKNCGIIVNVTPLEPEWRGRVTIEISNTTPLPAKIYAGEGIAQIIFLRAEAPCKVSYGDKKGKYQDQTGLTLPFVLGQEAIGPG
jgi:deoxycytidine triphosphate deaminase